MTNLLNLPQFPAGSAIAIVSNADWNDFFFVPQPGFPAIEANVFGDLSASQFDTQSPGSITAGMSVNGFGVAPGTIVEGTYPIGTISFNQPVTQSISGAELTFTSPPMDLTGISFASTLRPFLTSPRVIARLSTAKGEMVNGGASGTFGWNVKASDLAVFPWPPQFFLQGIQECVLDVVASDASGATINLCAANGPILVAVALAPTR